MTCCYSDSKISGCDTRCHSTFWPYLEPELDSKDGWISVQPELDIWYIPKCSIDTMWAFWLTFVSICVSENDKNIAWLHIDLGGFNSLINPTTYVDVCRVEGLWQLQRWTLMHIRICCLKSFPVSTTAALSTFSRLYRRLPLLRCRNTRSLVLSSAVGFGNLQHC